MTKKKPTHIKDDDQLNQPKVFKDMKAFLEQRDNKEGAELHPEFVAIYNDVIEKQGLPLEEWRQF